MQKTFNPINYNWRWTEDWYEWDEETARRQALKERNAYAKKMKAQGHAVHKSTMSNQLISRGGIGSGHPHISLVVNVYMVDVW